MDDLISRQATIDELRSYITEPGISDDESEIKGYNDGLDMAISVLSTMPPVTPKLLACEDAVSRNMLKEYFAKRQMDSDIAKEVFDAIDLMPSVTPKSKWIPCSERLPEVGRVVLWCNDIGSVFTTAITVRNDYSWAVGKRHRMRRIIAWMPLPEPYAEKMSGGEQEDD